MTSSSHEHKLFVCSWSSFVITTNETTENSSTIFLFPHSAFTHLYTYKLKGQFKHVVMVSWAPSSSLLPPTCPPPHRYLVQLGAYMFLFPSLEQNGRFLFIFSLSNSHLSEHMYTSPMNDRILYFPVFVWHILSWIRKVIGYRTVNWLYVVRFFFSILVFSRWTLNNKSMHKFMYVNPTRLLRL